MHLVSVAYCLEFSFIEMDYSVNADLHKHTHARPAHAHNILWDAKRLWKLHLNTRQAISFVQYIHPSMHVCCVLLYRLQMFALNALTVNWIDYDV